MYTFPITFLKTVLREKLQEKGYTPYTKKNPKPPSLGFVDH